MARPRKCRRVCCMPGNRHFGPLEDRNTERMSIVMTVDEYETIRLIDLERLTQEECAERMNIARTTAQAIYNSARRKLAEALVHGLKLSIHGGNYVLCNGETSGCGFCHCHPRRRRFGNGKSSEE
ncbi:MAG: DUF134 domain-containing protein [Christensenellales bacterium]|jgi:predicted DNA-binding protein (UPF0251 family)